MTMKLQVAFSFENNWYTLEVQEHEYRISDDGGTTWGPNDADDSDGWMSIDTSCDDGATPTPADNLCPKTDTTTMERVRVSQDAQTVDAANTYILQVRAVKVEPGATDATTDDTETKSAASRIDLVGPQTVTAGSMFTLTMVVAYTPTVEPAEDAEDQTSTFMIEVLDADGMVDADADAILTISVATEDGDSSITFNPTAAGMARVTLGAPADATSGSHTFPVEVLSEDTGPTARRIPYRELVDRRGETRINVSRFFTGDDLTYEAVSLNPRIVTVRIDSETGNLYITTERVGRTDIEVTATNPERGQVTTKLSVRVVDPNNAPQLAGNIPDLTLYLDDTGTQVDMRQYFRDEDNDFLQFIPQSANPMVITATVIGPTVIFNVVGLGEARMTIIAQDGRGGEAFGTFAITVLDPNFAPEPVGEMPPQEVRVEAELSLDVAQYFRDSNNDPLTYTARSSDEEILTEEVDGSMLTVTGVAPGEATVTVRASDPGGKVGYPGDGGHSAAGQQRASGSGHLHGPGAPVG